ncbi:RDD family protein [Polymorphospora rubra]|uniref:RDD family protein n=1 Tax=Polymorphospora rubra TaxID=338584 RepID=UPI0033C95078
MSVHPPSPARSGMAEAGLVGGEAVEVDVRVARIGSRVVALLIDIVMQVQIGLVLALVGVIGLTVTASRFTLDEAFERGLFTVGVIVVLVLYPTLFETFAGGRTIGKAALGLRVVREDGGPVRFRHALTRSLVGVAVEWPGLVLPLVTWLASLGAMMSNPRGRRLGDLAAGTLVIHDRTPATWGWIPGMPTPLAGWARTLDLTGLPDDLALAIRHYLARGHGLVEPARSRLGQQLAKEVAATTAPPPPPGIPSWAYLAAVLAERHRRAALRLGRARSASAALWPDLARSPLIGRPVPATWLESKAESWTPDGVRPPAPVQPGPDWPSQRWPTPPWLGPTAELPDWTGMRPPSVASTLRPSAPPDEPPG